MWTEFYIYKDAIFPDDVIVAIHDGKAFRCWYIDNDESQILYSVNQLFTNPNVGWIATHDDLKWLIATYTVHSNPEYFL